MGERRDADMDLGLTDPLDFSAHSTRRQTIDVDGSDFT